MTATTAPPTSATQFDRFTTYARAALACAHAEATRLNHTTIGTEHLLLGLIREQDGAAGRILRALGASLPAARASVEAHTPATTPSPGFGTMTMPARTLTSQTKQVLRLAVEDAEAETSAFVGTAHLLRALLRDPDDGATLALRRLDLAPDRIRVALARVGREPALAPNAPRRAVESDSAPDEATRFVLTLPAADLARLLALAKARDTTVGDLVRDAVARVWLAPSNELDETAPGA